MMRTLVALFMLSIGSFGQMVWFEPNRGQVAGKTEWVGRSKGAYLYITGDELVYAGQKNVHMRLVGASDHTKVEGLKPTGGYSSYFTGRDEKTWFTGIPHYGQLRYRDVYPGIDIVYYGTGRNVEYDFIVKPWADPARIELAFSETVKLDGGDLLVANLKQHRPRVLQDGREVPASYRLTEEGHVQLAVAEYDQLRELTVDPTLEFSTYLGGPGSDQINAVRVDALSNIYVAGGTQSPAAPTLNPFQQSNTVGLSPFVIKLAPTGDRVILFVILGPGANDLCQDFALDSVGNLVLTGETWTANFPVKNPVQKDFRAAYWTNFVTKISADGRSLVYSTFLGGSVRDEPSRIAIDAQDSTYIVGVTSSSDFPVKAAYQPSYAGTAQDCFLFKLSAAGTLTWSTYFGGSGLDTCTSVALDAAGNLLVTGASTGDVPLRNAVQTVPTPKTGYQTPILARFSSDGALLYSTYLGGKVAGVFSDVAVDSGGFVYLTGSVSDYGFTTKAAYQDTFPASTLNAGAAVFMKLNPSADQIIYSSYFGGSGGASGLRIAVDKNGFLYLSGQARSLDFPQKGQIQPFFGGGTLNADAYLAKFAADGKTLIYSTPIGGHNLESPARLAVDMSGSAYVAGWTWSSDLPTKAALQPLFGGGGTDGFLAKITDATQPSPSPLAVRPSRATFRYSQGGTLPASQLVTVSGGSFTLRYSAPWVSATAAGSSITISANPNGLAPGLYLAVLTLIPESGTPAAVDVVLTILAPPAILSAVEPALVPVGSDDTVITIRGERFSAASSLQVNGSNWTTTPIASTSPSTLQFTMPRSYLSLQYNHTIAVQNPNAELSNILSLGIGTPAPYFTAASVTNAASLVAGPIAPGEIVTIFGTNLSGAVTFDGVPATIIYSSTTQVSATVPYSVVGPTTALQVGSSAVVKLDVAAAAPGIFAAVAHQGVLTLYATGCGALTNDELPRCVLPVTVTVNGVNAEVLYAGIAPGLPEGVNQVNARLPDGTSGSLSIVLKAGEASSKEFLFTLP